MRSSIVDRSSPAGIGPVVDGTGVRLVIGDLWRPRWRWMLFGHIVCAGFLTGFQRTFDNLRFGKEHDFVVERY